MAKRPAVTSHYLEATGQSKKLEIKKSSGVLTVDNKPKNNGTTILHPYHGKKCC